MKTGESGKLFLSSATQFVRNTDKYIHRGVNPGDYYKATWCRDAAYILKDRFLTKDIGNVMQAIHFIWSHQITQGKEKIVYGRGSPDMKFLSQIASSEEEKEFEGALPTTIFSDFSEIYAKNPDIDSTALMVSSTAWIFDNYLRAGNEYWDSSAEKYTRHSSFSEGKNPTAEEELRTSKGVIDFTVPKMLKAMDYLLKRDIDGDNLLEQDHNEDWMDTVLRAGKIVYSQACWILALSNLSSLMSHLKKVNEANKMIEQANRTILAVEEHLWSDEEGCHIDLQVSHHLGKEYRTLTQDVSLYLVAITENTIQDVLNSWAHHSKTIVRRNDHPSYRKVSVVYDDAIHSRAAKTLDAVKNRLWNDKWPLVTETEMKRTGPWVLHPNQYHNHTFWPWMTGIEMLARSRFKRFNECNSLLSFLNHGEYPNVLAFYEWVDPMSGKGRGAFPFRTGISAIRIAITDILTSMQRSSDHEKKP